MGNCCCKSGAAGAVAASQSDGYGDTSAETGRSHLGAGTSSRGKKGGAVGLRLRSVGSSELLFRLNGTVVLLTGWRWWGWLS